MVKRHNQQHITVTNKSYRRKKQLESERSKIILITLNQENLWDMNVTGKVLYDEMGRVLQQGQPVFEAENPNMWYYNDKIEMNNPTTNVYDAIGRVTTVILPDGNDIETEYEINNDQYVTTVTDPKGNKKVSYADINENIVKIIQNNKITTTYEYDLLNQITSVKDHNGNTTSIIYDMMGRRTEINNLDSGRITYTYDTRSNLVGKLDDNLRKKSGGIKYEYDDAGRLVKISYPDNTKRTVTYTYGTNSDKSNNQAGRIKEITDESGTTELYYGKLGENTRVVKTLNRILESDAKYIFETGYLYDYLGRVESITYAGTNYNNNASGTVNTSQNNERETVVYEYDRGGQVNKVYGKFNDATQTTYVNNIGYDEFGQRVYIKYGNGVETKYTYDIKRRWLDNIYTKNGNNEVFQNMTYDFDEVGNIEKTTNNLVRSGKNYDVTQNYTYDDLYQLTESSGTYYDSLYKKTTTYGQTYNYDNIGNMTKKTSWKKIQNISTNDNFNYTYNYEYDTAHPHRAIQIGGLKYKYDDNGNLLKKYTQLQPVNNDEEEENTVNEPNSDDEAYGYNWDGTNTNEKVFEEYVWDEDNHLKKSTVNGRIAYYLYNAGGERTVKKEVSGNEVLYADKLYQVKVNMNKDCITKHIFVGDTRIISKVTFSNLTHNDTVEKQGVYYYHSDHLGSSNFISDYQGNEYEHIEYAPYGETWVEESKDSNDYINYMYTSKELDDETGLYYFGQRYLDTKTSRWMSADPIYDGVKDGIGIYTYCKNNPLIYVDPTGLAYDPYIGKDNPDVKKMSDKIISTPTTTKKQIEFLDASMNNDSVDKFVSKYGISQDFGVPSPYYGNAGDEHFGLDVATPEGTELPSFADGTVMKIETGVSGYSESKPMGNYIKVKDKDGNFRTYEHLKEVKVKVGDVIKRGDIIALTGNTGYSKGPHVHVDYFSPSFKGQKDIVQMNWGSNQEFPTYYKHPNKK